MAPVLDQQPKRQQTEPVSTFIAPFTSLVIPSGSPGLAHPPSANPEPLAQLRRIWAHGPMGLWAWARLDFDFDFDLDLDLGLKTVISMD